MLTQLKLREQTRRRALRSLKSSFNVKDRQAALRELSAILQQDREYPIGEAAHLSLRNALFDDAPSSTRDRVELFCYDNSAMLAKCQMAGIQLHLHGQ